MYKRVDDKNSVQINGDYLDHWEPIRIFVGTWNMGYKKIDAKHFSTDVMCSCNTHFPENYECMTCNARFSDPLSDWIGLDYDLYFITLQECVSPNFYELVSRFLEKCKHPLERVFFKTDRILGFGEGAVVSRKMTCIAAWVRKDFLANGVVRVCGSKALYLSVYNRSKGVVCLQIKVFGQLICLLGCHLPSDYMERQKSFQTILSKLTCLFGENEKLIFKDVFHHIIWAGDFNFKLNIPLEHAVTNIVNGTLDKLIKYDEFHLSSSPLKDQKFCEDVIKFDPTYKKRENREVLDKGKKNWFEMEYLTSESKWYTLNTERVPSWTDRVLKWSDKTLETCLFFEPTSYRSAVPKNKTPLLISDHSPVSCAFMLMPLNRNIAMPVKLNSHTFKFD
uniref:Inositol phosphatase, putative n=1 Tax=Theileria annulata TaxID=5874 RepID=A0A3B0MYU9_THEAN